MAVGFDIMNMILVKRHCLLERVWKSAFCKYVHHNVAVNDFSDTLWDDVFFT